MRFALFVFSVMFFCYSVGLAVFAFTLPEKTQDVTALHQTQGIVVFTGGSKRIDKAFELLKDGYEGLVLITGVSELVTEDALLADVPESLKSRITLDYTATTTRGNVVATTRWAQMNGIEEITLITSSYHMPRGLMALKQSGWQQGIVPFVVTPNKLPFTFLVREYTKYLLATLHII